MLQRKGVWGPELGSRFSQGEWIYGGLLWLMLTGEIGVGCAGDIAEEPYERILAAPSRVALLASCSVFRNKQPPAFHAQIRHRISSHQKNKDSTVYCLLPYPRSHFLDGRSSSFLMVTSFYDNCIAPTEFLLSVGKSSKPSRSPLDSY
jgi:hypothetical protein